MKTLLLALTALLLSGCALKTVKEKPLTKAEKIEGCISRITDDTGADAMQAFEICRQMHRLRKVD